MSQQIEVIRDPVIEMSSIVQNITNPASEGIESDEVNYTEIQQTKVTGILVPLIAINGFMIEWEDVLEFALDTSRTVPEVRFKIQDNRRIFTKFSHIGNNSELRIQILPPVENTYKKIDLVMMITEVRASQEGNNIIDARATYKLPGLTKKRFKALGNISTYELLDKISLETGLGYASNLPGPVTNDARYIQCRYESFKDILDKEILKSGSSEYQVLDYWIDERNYLNLCDIYERINSVDTEEDMMIWCNFNNQTASMNYETEPLRMPAVYSNHPSLGGSDLAVESFDVKNNPISQIRGNTHLYSVYQESTQESLDHFIALDSISEQNDFLDLEYAGEVYGSYNYFLAEKLREVYLSKIKSEIIIIKTNNPQLGLIKGSQIRFVWYDNDSARAMFQDNIEDIGLIANESELSTEIGWLREWIIQSPNPDNPLKINTQYSGQYTVIGQFLAYNKRSTIWSCWIYLSRPAKNRPEIVNEIKNT